MTRILALNLSLLAVVTVTACRARNDAAHSGAAGAALGPGVTHAVQQSKVAVPPGSAAAEAAAERPVHLAPPARLAVLADIGKALEKPFSSPIEAQVGKARVPRQLKNCRDFLAVVDMSPTAESESEWDNLNDEGVHCVALDLLRTARPARTSFIEKFSLGKDSVTKLPADFDVAIADETVAKVAAAAAKGLRWKDMGGGKKVAVRDSATIEVETKNDLTMLFEYARADFDGDGVEDMLVRRDYAVHRGSYRAYALLVVTRTDAHAPLKVIRTLSATK